MTNDINEDIAVVQRIAAVPTILDVICRTTGMGFAAVARVTEDRWVACQVLDNIHFGLPAGGELPVETTLCHEVRGHRDVIVIDNVAEDPLYCDHHTPKLYGLQSYISMPIVLPDGRFFGTLCAIDPKPAKLNNPQVLGIFKLFAEMIAYHIDADEKLRASETSLSEAQQLAELRELFIAVLGHDLRNPLAGIGGGVDMLLRNGWTERTPKILQLMKAGVARMNGLVENVMDLARSRLGGGIELSRDESRPVEVTLTHVVDEMRIANPDREFDLALDIREPVSVDHARLAQMLSNLLGNALSHGAEDQPIRLEGSSADGIFRLSVANAGTAIDPDRLADLFRPFYRGGGSHATQQGLGLGLYIAGQIAEAHGGTLSVQSDEVETRFTFVMPTR